MHNKLSSKKGILFGAGGGLGAVLAMACCLPLILTGLIAALGLNFLMPDDLLIVIITLGITTLFILWRLQKRRLGKND